MSKATTTSKASKQKNAAKKGSKTEKKGSVKVNAKTAKKLQKGKKSNSEKKSRLAGVERGDAPNLATAYIHGTFNVNLAKKELRKFIRETLGYDMGTINAQYAYSALAEVLSVYLVSATAKYNTKNKKKANLYEVSLENIQRAIRESNEYGANVKQLSDSFNPTAMDYTSTFFDETKTLRGFLEKNAFQNTTNIYINQDALNFVCYIMSHSLAMITRTACILSNHARKKNVQIRNFTYAVQIHFSGELGELMNQRMSEIDNLFANKKEDEEEDEASDSGKNASGKAKKAKKDDEESEEEEDDEDEDSDEEEDDGSDDEEEDSNDEEEDSNDEEEDSNDEEEDSDDEEDE